MGESADTAEEAASLLATAMAGTNNPEAAAAIATFADAHRQANDLLIQATPPTSANRGDSPLPPTNDGITRRLSIDKILKSFLPAGATLTVVEVDGTHVIYRGEG